MADFHSTAQTFIYIDRRDGRWAVVRLSRFPDPWGEHDLTEIASTHIFRFMAERAQKRMLRRERYSVKGKPSQPPIEFGRPIWNSGDRL